MTGAWYGVVPTRAQAAVAINLLSELFSQEYSSAGRVVSNDFYVDDENPGAETESKLDEQILSTQAVLSYRRDLEKVEFYPGVAELNLNKEVEELSEQECFKDITSLFEPLILEKEIVGSNIGENLSFWL